MQRKSKAELHSDLSSGVPFGIRHSNRKTRLGFYFLGKRELGLNSESHQSPEKAKIKMSKMMAYIQILATM